MDVRAYEHTNIPACMHIDAHKHTLYYTLTYIHICAYEC